MKVPVFILSRKDCELIDHHHAHKRENFDRLDAPDTWESLFAWTQWKPQIPEISSLPNYIKYGNIVSEYFLIA